MNLAERLRDFLQQEESPTMVEYALLVALIALLAIAGAALFGLGVSELFEVPPSYFGS